MSVAGTPAGEVKGPFLSVVIPAYNEEPRILNTLEELMGYLGRCAYSYEVMVVDDGSADATASLVEGFARDHPEVSLIRVPHGGKGWATNQGMLRAAGEYRFLCDADLSMPVEHLSRFLPPLLSDFDIAIGSREVAGARRMGEPYRRHMMGRAYNLLVQMLALPGLSDTQCGFKCFRRQAAQTLFPLQRVYGFAFDVEILLLARMRKLRIAEVPIDWYYRTESKVSPIKDALKMSGDILKVRWHLLRGVYKSLPEGVQQDRL